MLLNDPKIVDELTLDFARSDYDMYLQHVHHGMYRESRHTNYIARKLEAVERGEVKRIMFFLPPRHSKSTTVTETFPSYFIGKNPDRRVIEVSYGDSLARRFGRSNKQKIEEFGPALFGRSTARDNRSATDWNMEEADGGMISVGIGGGITGHGADLMIIDDPIKNRKEAESETYRDRLWSEWKDTLRTRLQPNGAVILILTRWHEDDLAGRILEHEGDKWEVVTLPAIAEDENDPLGREIGEPLWPSYGFDTAWATDTKQTVGSQTWNALFQQRPSPPEGALFKRGLWQHYKKLPTLDEQILSADCAFKDTDGSDYVVIQCWGRRGADKYLIDQVRARMDITATMNAIRSMSAKHRKARAKLVEDKANGPAVIQMLKKEIAGLIGVNPEGGKVVRAHAVQPDQEAGNVYIPDPAQAPWIHDFIEECANFPNGKHDDMVDAFSQGVNYLNRHLKPDIF